MPEGPSLILFKEELQRFVGQEILSVSGSSKIDQQRLAGQRIHEIKTWGKHLLLCFEGFTIRLHFLMFGVYYVNSEKDRVPRLFIQFEQDYLNLYSCGVKMFDEPLNDVYDWSADVLNPAWNPKAAAKKLKALPGAMTTDALLNQEIFSGIGNMLKNELLHRNKIHPESVVGSLPPKKLAELVADASPYTKQFLKWKRVNNTYLRSQWRVHTKKDCPQCDTKLSKDYLGELQRLTFWCDECQKLY